MGNVLLVIPYIKPLCRKCLIECIGNMLILTLALGILTIGLAIKSGLFPFHFWMPDTYGYSTPTSASAGLSR